MRISSTLYIYLFCYFGAFWKIWRKKTHLNNLFTSAQYFPF